MKEVIPFEPVKHVATVRGKARHLLLGERVGIESLGEVQWDSHQVSHTSDKSQAIDFLITGPKRFNDIAKSYGYKVSLQGQENNSR